MLLSIEKDICFFKQRLCLYLETMSPKEEMCFRSESLVSKKRIKSLKEESSPQTENFNRTAKKRAKIKRKEERA